MAAIPDASSALPPHLMKRLGNALTAIEMLAKQRIIQLMTGEPGSLTEWGILESKDMLTLLGKVENVDEVVLMHKSVGDLLTGLSAIVWHDLDTLSHFPEIRSRQDEIRRLILLRVNILFAELQASYN